MKFLKPFFVVMSIFISSISFAQKLSFKERNVYSLTENVGAGSFANALAVVNYNAIGKNKRFKIGYGLRLTNFFGSDLTYATAPAKYTSGKSSIAALFSENILQNIDTVTFSNTQTNFLNLGIYFSYLLPYFKNKFELGVNIDAVGFSFGGKQNGLYHNQLVSAKPTPLNLLLISDSDIGSLNSEWYVSYWATKKVAIKLGYQFLFNEYTTDNKIQQLPNSTDTNDRFRSKSRMILFGIKYSPFRK